MEMTLEEAIEYVESMLKDCLYDIGYELQHAELTEEAKKTLVRDCFLRVLNERGL